MLIRTETLSMDSEAVWINPRHVVKVRATSYTNPLGEQRRGSAILFVSGHSLSVAIDPEVLSGAC